LILPLFVVFFLGYGFGQALTDCFQTDTDSLSAPYRPLVQGLVARRDVMLVSLLGLVLSGAALLFYHPLNLPLALFEILGLATYTIAKRRWWAGPFYNAWIVALLVGIGYVSVRGAAGEPLVWKPELLWATLAAFFGYANFVLAGYFKDVSADRATGYNTLPVVGGFRVSAHTSDVFALLTLLAVFGGVSAVFGSAEMVPAQIVGLVLIALGTGTLIMAQVRLHCVTDESQAHTAVSPVVRSYVLLLAGVTAVNRPEWALFLILFCGSFEWVLRRRPMREQI
jgi:4-hydroxybenzoate polyprenyltransferase